MCGGLLPASATRIVTTDVTRPEEPIIPGNLERPKSRIAGRRRGPFFLEELDYNAVSALFPVGKQPLDPAARELLPEPTKVVEFPGIEIGEPSLAERILQAIVAKKSLDGRVDAGLIRARRQFEEAAEVPFRLW
jgi:hypothetical protein